MTYVFHLILAGCSGYISLSQEILWIRAASYATHGRPECFGLVLGMFLIGVALGSLFAKKKCEDEFPPDVFIGVMLFLGTVTFYFALPISGYLLTCSQMFGMTILFTSIAITSFFVGSIFPVVCHLAVKTKEAIGMSVSIVYLSNIIGATAGPLVTGFILMDKFTLEQNILYLTIFSGVLAFGLLARSSESRPLVRVAMTSIGLLGLSLILHESFYGNLLEKMHYKERYSAEIGPYKYVHQNRSGVIAVGKGVHHDIIYGGGIYDGKFNLNPMLNTNKISRAYMMAALQPSPKKAFMVGLGGGSWARVVANHTGVEQLTIVEINPGYQEIIKEYPDHATLFDDPKVKIYYDDGRRWLNRNPEEKYDMIVINTTFHWRYYSTNLLSEEFLKLAQSHLEPGGVIYYNATGSDDVVYTAANVFEYVTRYSTFVAASDSPFELDPVEKRANLLKFKNNGVPVFSPDVPGSISRLEELAKVDTSSIAEQIRERTELHVITDDNMVTEFRTTIPDLVNRLFRFNTWYDPKKSWRHRFRLQTARISDNVAEIAQARVGTIRRKLQGSHHGGE